MDAPLVEVVLEPGNPCEILAEIALLAVVFVLVVACMHLAVEFQETNQDHLPLVGKVVLV